MEKKYDLATVNSEGLKLYNLGEYKKALDIFDKIISIKPHYDAALLNKGLCLDAIEDFSGALDCYNLVIEKSAVIKSGELTDVFYFKGIALFYLSRFEEAIEVFQYDIDYHEEDIESRSTLFLSLCYLHQKDYITSIGYNEKVIERYPKHINALNNMGVCLLEQEKFEEALTVFEKILSIDSLFAPAYFNLGLIEKHNKSIELAKKHFEKVKELDSNYIGVDVELTSIS